MIDSVVNVYIMNVEHDPHINKIKMILMDFRSAIY